jgi:hypothetical protein
MPALLLATLPADTPQQVVLDDRTQSQAAMGIVRGGTDLLAIKKSISLRVDEGRAQEEKAK